MELRGLLFAFVHPRLIVTQALAWVTFFAIYIILMYAEIDVPAKLKDWGYSVEIIKIAETGGLFALTFALNRVFMPIRLGIAVLMMPIVANPINKLIQPWMDRFFPKKESADKKDK